MCVLGCLGLLHLVLFWEEVDEFFVADPDFFVAEQVDEEVAGEVADEINGVHTF